jgi:ABC-type uncharacterized transport system permease subunit
MELFLLYLWLKLDGFIALSVLFTVLSVITLLISLGNYRDARSNLINYRALYDPKKQEARLASWKPWIKGSFISSLCFLFLTALLPSSKDTAILVGASVALDMAKSPEGQKIGTLIRGKANELLDNEIKKLNQPATK